jgi:phage gp16-like protein
MMSDRRNKELARIHIMRSQIGMTEDSYRAMLQTVGRVKSAADLDVYGRSQVIAHLRALLPKQPNARHSQSHPQDKKIKALWHALAAAGVVHNDTGSALRAYICRQTGCERLEWLTSRQASQVIESLKKWKTRATA